MGWFSRVFATGVADQNALQPITPDPPDVDWVWECNISTELGKVCKRAAARAGLTLCVGKVGGHVPNYDWLRGVYIDRHATKDARQRYRVAFEEEREKWNNDPMKR